MSGRRARGWIAAGGALLVCAGCGFKGPLYLPAPSATVVTHPAEAPPSPGQTQGQTQVPAARKKSKAPQATQPPLG